MKTLIVTAGEGRHITGYGCRAAGGEFELPDDLADVLLENQPHAFEEVEEQPAEQPVNTQSESGEED